MSRFYKINDSKSTSISQKHVFHFSSDTKYFATGGINVI